MVVSGRSRSRGASGETPRARIAPTDGRAYVCGTRDVPLEHIIIPELLARTTDRHGENEAAVFCATGERWSYAEFSDKVDQLAAGLLDLDIYKGDRVAIWSPNRPEWLLTQFATARIGAILVNINPAYRLVELEYALNKVGAKALITAVSLKTSHYLDMLRELAPELNTATPARLKAERLPALKTVVSFGLDDGPGIIPFAQVIERSRSGQRARLDAITASLSPDDAINIQFTSGTTGAPKGATLTHNNIANNARFIAASMHFTEQDRLCIPVPLYHCFGMVMGNLVCVASGATMVFPGETFDPSDTLKALSDERCTAVHGVPTMFIAMVEHPQIDTFDLRGLRTGVMSGAPCPIELMKRVVADMHLSELTICYGMTETSPVSFQTRPDDSMQRRVSTVGRIQPHAEVKVIGENGDIVGVGERGELCTRGYLVMQRYWGDRERTAEAIDDDGWMHTGDLGTVDAAGYCNIVGRVGDMLIRGGENIYPREIEDYLFRHPDITDVQVFGVPDERLGEEICSWIVARAAADLTAEDVLSFCRGQIAHFKIPRYIRFVDEMPMTVTGKPQKFIMREKMIEELGLTEETTA